MQRIQHISATVVDIVHRRLFGARLEVNDNGLISAIHPEDNPEPGYILPGFVDAHVHVESSMLCPTAFARAAVCHGTLAAVTDPHEIANVLGLAGVEFMLAESARTPFHFAVGAPSCVPATPFDSAGAVLNADAVAGLLARTEISHLTEMMNVPGVLGGDGEVAAKLAAARKMGKPVDGHAPGLQGKLLHQYLQAGISTDHECASLNEALEKAGAGMHILLRQGSAARGFKKLLPVLAHFPQQCMFCTDDKHPDELLQGYINELVQIAVDAGFDLFDVLRAASFNPVRHYGLEMGLLQVGDRADWIEVENLRDFRIRRSVLGAGVVAENGLARLEIQSPLSEPNHFLLTPVSPDQFRIPAHPGNCRAIGIRDGDLVTDEIICLPKINRQEVIADPERDLLKLAVFNRYSKQASPALALVSGLGLKQSALAASVAHDAHHLICAGTNDVLMAQAANAVIEHGGGLATVNSQGEVALMPLPVAGLMTTSTCAQAAEQYRLVTEMARACGCHLQAPFMALSFLALPVIPALKLTDQGLFDACRFVPVGFWVNQN
ncbi:MAG: adenine deaminase [Desulfobulbus sp.]|nr:adenine deaminase [Desulfobulbus sp.]